MDLIQNEDYAADSCDGFLVRNNFHYMKKEETVY